MRDLRRTRVRAAAAVLGTLAVVVGACGGDGDGDGGSDVQQAESTVVESPDGMVSIEVPPGAVDDGIELSIEPLDPADLPPELDGIEVANTYALLPDGTTFTEPATLRHRLADEEVGTVGIVDVGVPALRSADGEWERLGDPTVQVDADEIIVLGAITHFSTYVDLVGVQFTYPEVDRFGEGEVPISGTFGLRAMGDLDTLAVDYAGPTYQPNDFSAWIGMAYDDPDLATSFTLDMQSEAWAGALGGEFEQPTSMLYKFDTYSEFIQALLGEGEISRAAAFLAPAFDPNYYEFDPDNPGDPPTVVDPDRDFGLNAPSRFAVEETPDGPVFTVTVDSFDGGPGTGLAVLEPGDGTDGVLLAPDGRAVDAATGDPIDVDFRVDGNRWSMPYDQVRRSSFVEPFATNPEFTVLSNGGIAWFDLDAIGRYW